MAQYLIRSVNKDFQMAKFEDSDSPTDVYTLTNTKCTCPSRYSNCKHRKVLGAWKKQGMPVGAVYDDTAQLLGSLQSGGSWVI